MLYAFVVLIKLGAASLFFLLMFASCSVNEPSVPMQTYKVRLNIGIPVDENANIQGGRRAPKRIGDPGTFENFLYPRYMYLYYVWEKKVDAKTSVHEPDGIINVGSNRLMTLDPTAWHNGVYNGRLMYASDSIFTYTGEVSMILPDNLSEYDVRVYVAMSYDQLANLYKTDVNNELQVQNLTFELDNDTLISRLQHVYSTPYNYEVEGKYYGTLVSDSKGLSLNLLLYHVACKVDLIWNVPDEQQGDFFVKQIMAQQLYKKSAYVFRPNENYGKPVGVGENYDLMIKNAGDVALQYKGRSYFYTIPYYYVEDDKRYFDIVLNADFYHDGEDANRLLTLKKVVDTESPFVPWIRGNLMFSTMPTVNQVKIVD